MMKGVMDKQISCMKSIGMHSAMHLPYTWTPIDYCACACTYACVCGKVCMMYYFQLYMYMYMYLRG